MSRNFCTCIVGTIAVDHGDGGVIRSQLPGCHLHSHSFTLNQIDFGATVAPAVAIGAPSGQAAQVTEAEAPHAYAAGPETHVYRYHWG